MLGLCSRTRAAVSARWARHTNAAKYGTNERGEVAIKVGLEGQSESYELYVEDNGPGFDFEQARKQSSGLGLVIALARQLNAVFTVERKLGARCAAKFQDEGTRLQQRHKRSWR